RSIDLLAGASAAGALFFIGGTLVSLSMRAMAGEVLPVALGKLLLHPLAVAGALWLVGPVSAPLTAVAILMAGAPMLSIYPVFAQKHGLQGVCSARMVGTTLASFASIGALIALLHQTGLAPAH
ncbi:MAG TPA: AEC family transporter, partial [Burkholderiaceae bacterium]|nr:AEC family transporter [Burkholderiaceae bacterium]